MVTLSLLLVIDAMIFHTIVFYVYYVYKMLNIFNKQKCYSVIFITNVKSKPEIGKNPQNMFQNVNI